MQEAVLIQSYKGMKKELHLLGEEIIQHRFYMVNRTTIVSRLEKLRMTPSIVISCYEGSMDGRVYQSLSSADLNLRVGDYYDLFLCSRTMQLGK